MDSSQTKKLKREQLKHGQQVRGGADSNSKPHKLQAKSLLTISRNSSSVSMRLTRSSDLPHVARIIDDHFALLVQIMR